MAKSNQGGIETNSGAAMARYCVIGKIEPRWD